MKSNWFPFSLLGAFIYGSYSLLLEMVSPELKAHQGAQFGYGLLLVVLQTPIILLLYKLWSMYNKEDNKILLKNLNWKIMLSTMLFNVLIGPVHILVINAGGSVGQQAMYSLAIIPVLIGGRIIFKESLNLKQWLGIGMAASGAYLMSSGSKTK